VGLQGLRWAMAAEPSKRCQADRTEPRAVVPCLYYGRQSATFRPPGPVVMSNLVVLHDIELVPVLELEPMKFATTEHPLPSGTGAGMPEAWHRYWLDSLADSGITGLEPLQPGSWHVSTRRLTDPGLLHKSLTVTVEGWGGTVIFTDPDSKPVLNGGLALFSQDELIVQPTCCSDLRNLADWQRATAYRGTTWEMLWIGHPWLSVRYESPWLVISDLHESDTPTGRWAVSADDLHQAVADAERELQAFAVRMQPILEAMGVVEVERNAGRMAGLKT
jgi:hypothetical protein